MKLSRKWRVSSHQHLKRNSNSFSKACLTSNLSSKLENIDQTNIVDTLLNAGGSIGEAIITQPADLESFANPIIYIYDQVREKKILCTVVLGSLIIF